LARVDEVPNQMTCMVPCREGLRVESQNVLGTRKLDLLRMTDWFFPGGMNHHELFAGVPGVSQVMQAFARRVAGLGTLPKDPIDPRPASRVSTEALVIGAGASGFAAAVALARRGMKVQVIDDSLEAWGGARALPDDERASFAKLEADAAELCATGAITVQLRTTAAAIFGNDVLLVSPRGTSIVTAAATILATGAHDGVLAFEGNDIPGVISARAAGWLLRQGISIGDHVLVAVAPGGGQWGEPFARENQRLGHSTKLVYGVPLRAKGSSRVREVEFASNDDRTTERVDALVIDAPPSPAYELCEQAGATLVHTPAGFVVSASAIRPGFFATGEVLGMPLDARLFVESANAIAASL
jgi:sarcosine oxidase subunit alpha